MANSQSVLWLQICFESDKRQLNNHIHVSILLVYKKLVSPNGKLLRWNKCKIQRQSMCVSFQCHIYVEFLNWRNSIRAKVKGRWPATGLWYGGNNCITSAVVLQLILCLPEAVKHAKRNIELCTGWKGTETWQARWASGIWQKRRMSLFSYLLIKLNVSTWQLDQHGYCQKLHSPWKRWIIVRC